MYCEFFLGTFFLCLCRESHFNPLRVPKSVGLGFPLIRSLFIIAINGIAKVTDSCIRQFLNVYDFSLFYSSSLTTTIIYKLHKAHVVNKARENAEFMGFLLSS